MTWQAELKTLRSEEVSVTADKNQTLTLEPLLVIGLAQTILAEREKEIPDFQSRANTNSLNPIENELIAAEATLRKLIRVSNEADLASDNAPKSQSTENANDSPADARLRHKREERAKARAEADDAEAREIISSAPEALDQVKKVFNLPETQKVLREYIDRVFSGADSQDTDDPVIALKKPENLQHSLTEIQAKFKQISNRIGNSR
jgi:hypothetical protein